MRRAVEQHPVAGLVGADWGLTALRSDAYSKLAMQFRRSLRDAEEADWSWYQEDVISRLVQPILLALGYQERDIHRTVSSIPGSQHRADMHIRNSLQSYCILEVKRVRVELTANEGYPDFESPIDQGLRYFAQSGAERCIVTNGVDWYLFRPAVPAVAEYGFDYAAVLFRLDLELSQYQHRFPDFVGLFHADSIFSLHPPVTLFCDRALVVQRKRGPASNVLLHDATAGIGARDGRFRSSQFKDPFAPY